MVLLGKDVPVHYLQKGKEYLLYFTDVQTSSNYLLCLDSITFSLPLFFHLSLSLPLHLYPVFHLPISLFIFSLSLCLPMSISIYLSVSPFLFLSLSVSFIFSLLSISISLFLTPSISYFQTNCFVDSVAPVLSL